MNITWVIDSATREHHLVRSTGFLIPVKVDETGWIPWKGDNQFSPVPCGTKVEIKYYDEDTELTECPEMKDWSRGIIAYRPFNEWHGKAGALSAMIAAIPFSEALARDMLKHRRDELRCQAEEGEG